MPEPTERPEVLFVGVHNAGRSQMSAGQGIDAVRAIRDQIDELVLQLLAELV